MNTVDCFDSVCLIQKQQAGKTFLCLRISAYCKWASLFNGATTRSGLAQNTDLCLNYKVQSLKSQKQHIQRTIVIIILDWNCSFGVAEGIVYQKNSFALLFAVVLKCFDFCHHLDTIDTNGISFLNLFLMLWA